MQKINKKINNGILVMLFLFCCIIPVYSYYDLSDYNGGYYLNRNILTQYTPDPTPGPGNAVDITVIDSITKEPIDQVRVDIYYGGMWVRTGYTNSLGEFSSGQFDDTITSVKLSKAWYNTREIEGIASGVIELVAIIPDPDNHYDIHGTVRESDTGLPLEGVEIYFSSRHNNSYDSETVYTDASGLYAFTADTGTTAKLYGTIAGYNSFSTDLEPGIQTIDFTLEPVPPGAGDVRIFPASQTINVNENVFVEVHVNSGNQKFAAFSIDIKYDPVFLILRNVYPGPDGFLSAHNAVDPRIIYLDGFDPRGTGPGEDLHIATIEFRGSSVTGTSSLVVIINELSDPNLAVIGCPNGINGAITITGPSIGDVNSDGSVDIVDALLVAQYYVSGDSSILELSVADVNNSGTVDIIDALRIAQLYVGIISHF